MSQSWHESPRSTRCLRDPAGRTHARRRPATENPGSPQALLRDGGRLRYSVDAHVRPQNLRHHQAAVWLLIGLKYGGNRPGQSQAGAIERVDQFGLGTGLRPVPDRPLAGLVVAEGGAGTDFEPALDAGRPDLQVVLLGLDEPHISFGHDLDSICQTEPL